ncbi:hypothetical protein [Sediminicoccus sp. KRV36]|uniref:hypothetical protein n=1 Tax=Sediminicoccus sp. KRV36 TaxID=3133721 RepID=UPI002010B0B8|nr:hypothetical protein [Sediminicoccus rosea]UPY36817.1 hypothetical protein LHU95_21795 [Sediminicoccus rosea]
MLLLDLAVLPVNSFTFRQWEALMTRNGANRDAPFFPHATLRQTEYGDRFRYATLVQPRVTLWQTDNLGYRNAEPYPSQERPCFVTLGDSNIVGSSFDQPETLASALQRLSGCRAYNAAAPNSIQRYFYQPTFRANPPRFLVVGGIAGHFYDDGGLALYDVSGRVWAIEPAPPWYLRLLAGAISWIAPESMRAQAWVLDEIMERRALANFLRARSGMTDLPPPPVAARHSEFRNVGAPGTEGGTAWRWHGTARHPNVTAPSVMSDCPAALLETIDPATRQILCRFATLMRALAAAVRAEGTELIFYLQPSSDRLLAPAAALLRTEGIRIIDFPPTREFIFGMDFDWYWAADDSHWHPRAAELAARLIQAVAEGQPIEPLVDAERPRVIEDMRNIRSR